MKRKRELSSESESEEEDKMKKRKEGERGYIFQEEGTMLAMYNKQTKKKNTVVKIAGFDFDGTIVSTASGRAFPLNNDDWTLFHSSVPSVLINLIASGYLVVFFTNQGGVSIGKNTLDGLKEKFLNVAKEIGTEDLIVLAALEVDMFRKPATGMWEFLKSKFLSGVEVDMKESFFVGDAAGRRDFMPLGKKKTKNDHSCDDRKFALNVGISFKTPDEFFLGKAPHKNWILKSFDAKGMKTVFEEKMKNRPAIESYLSKKQEVVVFCGYPASSKTTFRDKVFVTNGYEYVNQDELKKKEMCVKRAKEFISKGKSVVIDNTNPSSETRKLYVELARDFGVSIRCFYFNVSMELARHLNKLRLLKTGKKVPAIAFNSFKKHFEMPTKGEGFEDVLEVDFIPEFANSDDELFFYQYTSTD